jgi:hypothetical protein
MSVAFMNRVAQALLFSIWLIIVAIEFLPTVASSQTCPNPTYSNPVTITVNSWVPLTQVTVQIDDSFSSDKAAGLQAGNEKWNNPALISCSGVRFVGFERVAIAPEDYEETPPGGRLVWQNDDPENGKNGIVLAEVSSGGRVVAARIKILPSAVNIAQGTYYNYLGTHEVGHTFNLRDCVSTSGCQTGTEPTIMRGHSDGITSSNTFNTDGPKECDIQKVLAIYCPQTPSPTPTPTPSPTPPQTETECQSWGWDWNSFTSSCSPGGSSINPCPDNCTPDMFSEPGQGGNSCVGPTDFCVYPSGGCESGYANAGNGCCCSSFNSPILIDVNGNGFSLTSAENGVDFDINGDGIKERISWTAPISDNAWLVLDHSNNGAIDNGRELFGNYTPQTKPPFGVPANGFIALAEYDKPPNGGNQDGVINQFDSVFTRLRLWRDENHNGVAENAELHSLWELQVSTLELTYKESKQIDQYGNQFRYRGKVKNMQGQQMGRWAWDVFLVKKTL